MIIWAQETQGTLNGQNQERTPCYIIVKVLDIGIKENIQSCMNKVLKLHTKANT